MVVRLGSHWIVYQINKLKPGELPQARDLCQRPDLVAPCSRYLHPASVRVHGKGICSKAGWRSSFCYRLHMQHALSANWQICC